MITESKMIRSLIKTLLRMKINSEERKFLKLIKDNSYFLDSEKKRIDSIAQRIDNEISEEEDC